MLDRSKLLIVDDVPETRELLSRIFSSQGLVVACAEDGFTALRAIGKQVPDIILSDLNMPGMSGFELLSVVRRRLPGIYVIASSGAFAGSVVPEGISADAFYQKASGLDQLFRVMAKARGAVRSDRPYEELLTPVWLTLNETGEAHAGEQRLACPQCLRVFPPEPGGPARGVRRVQCLHCKVMIRYFLVTVLDPVDEQNYHASLRTEDGTADALPR